MIHSGDGMDHLSFLVPKKQSNNLLSIIHKEFVENMKYDLRDFYILNKTQAEHSIYLGLLNEALWDTLAKLTDRSQVEWAEITEDFTHDGIYQSGDFIGFGELACEECDNLFMVSHYIEIIPCTNCGHTRFTRTPLQP